jgi:CubicO group peptidase (beta-lactamase class C family)
VTEGTCKKGFERIAEVFAQNFAERGEVGASVCLTLGGETVVDLWGGIANPRTGAPWMKDTVCTVFSCTKGATALCAHILASRGKLDLDAPVTGLWPEFGQHGKERVTVRMMLDHSAAVPALRQKVRDDGPYDWNYMTDRLAAEEPFWVPGTRNGYHGLTFGWTVGEMVRRASGKSLGTFFRDEVAKPLGLDFWIGTPEEVEPRIAPILAFAVKAEDARTPFLKDLSTDRTSIPFLFYMNSGAWRAGGANSRAGHAAEVGAANGITNARGLAGMYAPLSGDGSMRGGGRLVDARTLSRMGEVSMATHDDATLRIPTRFALGYMKSMDNRKRSIAATIWDEESDSVILSSAAFGHVGAGGSLGFADPAAGFSFGYVMNQMGPGLLMNARGQRLVDAAYLSMGFKNKDSGVWVR